MVPPSVRSVIQESEVFYSTMLSVASVGRKGKGKAFPNKSRRLRRAMECWASILTFTFGTPLTAQLSAIRAVSTLPSRELLGTHFC